MPPGVWITPYIEKIVQRHKGLIKSQRDESTATKTCIVFKVDPGKLGGKSLHKVFATATYEDERLTAFGVDGKIRVFADAQELVHYHAIQRLRGYADRKAHILPILDEHARKAEAKAMFIRAVEDGSIPVFTAEQRLRTKADFEADLATAGYPTFDDGNYDYLVRLPLLSLTQEAAEKAEAEARKRREEHRECLALAPHEMWLLELDAFEDAYKSHVAEAQGQEEEEEAQQAPQGRRKRKRNSEARAAEQGQQGKEGQQKKKKKKKKKKRTLTPPITNFFQ